MQITDEMVQRALDAWFGERTPKWRNARLTDVQAAETFMRAALSAAMAEPAPRVVAMAPVEGTPGIFEPCTLIAFDDGSLWSRGAENGGWLRIPLPAAPFREPT